MNVSLLYAIIAIKHDFPILLRMPGTLGDAKNLEILPRFLTIPSGPGERLSMKNHDWTYSVKTF